MTNDANIDHTTSIPVPTTTGDTTLSLTGEFAAQVGPSDSGKSTILGIIACLESADAEWIP